MYVEEDSLVAILQKMQSSAVILKAANKVRSAEQKNFNLITANSCQILIIDCQNQLFSYRARQFELFIYLSDTLPLCHEDDFLTARWAGAAIDSN